MIHLNVWNKKYREQRGVHRHHGAEGEFLLHGKENVSPLGIFASHCGLTLIFT